MQRFPALGALGSMMLLAALALAPSGCSHDDASMSSPDLGMPSSGYDEYPPATPTGLEVVKANPTAFKLEWDANSEGDLAGYRVYLYDPSPYRGNSYVCAHGGNALPARQTWFAYTDDIAAGEYFFRVAAVDSDGNESVASSPLSFCFDPTSSPESSRPDRGSGNQTEDNPGWWQPEQDNRPHTEDREADDPFGE